MFCGGGGLDRRRSAVKLPVPPPTSARVCVRKASKTHNLSVARDPHLSWGDTVAARRDMHPMGAAASGGIYRERALHLVQPERACDSSEKPLVVVGICLVEQRLFILFATRCRSFRDLRKSSEADPSRRASWLRPLPVTGLAGSRVSRVGQAWLASRCSVHGQQGAHHLAPTTENKPLRELKARILSVL